VSNQTDPVLKIPLSIMQIAFMHDYEITGITGKFLRTVKN